MKVIMMSDAEFEKIDLAHAAMLPFEPRRWYTEKRWWWADSNTGTVFEVWTPTTCPPAVRQLVEAVVAAHAVHGADDSPFYVGHGQL